jgi:hypothetical protein
MKAQPHLRPFSTTVPFDGRGSEVLSFPSRPENYYCIMSSSKWTSEGETTPIAWESSSNAIYNADSTQMSFLFTVNNPSGIKWHKLLIPNSVNAIYCDSWFGQIIGINYDLFVFD